MEMTCPEYFELLGAERIADFAFTGFGAIEPGLKKLVRGVASSRRFRAAVPVAVCVPLAVALAAPPETAFGIVAVGVGFSPELGSNKGRRVFGDSIDEVIGAVSGTLLEGASGLGSAPTASALTTTVASAGGREGAFEVAAALAAGALDGAVGTATGGGGG